MWLTGSNRSQKSEVRGRKTEKTPSSVFCPLSSGFTLLELLIISSIIAMIALAVFSTFSMGIKAYKRMHYSGLVQADVLLSLEKLEKDLHNVLNFSGIGFAGENKKISFAGLVGPQTDSNLGRIAYYLDAKTRVLVKEENAYAGTFSGSKALASIKDIAFTYYYFDPQAREYVWQDSWQSVNGIPKAVRVKAVFKSENDKDVEITRTILIPAER